MGEEQLKVLRLEEQCMGQSPWGAGASWGRRGRWGLEYLVNEFDFQTTNNGMPSRSVNEGILYS